MSRVASTHWVDDRILSQRVSRRASSTLPSVRELSVELIGTRAEVRHRGGIIPTWVLFGMIILATFGLCVTANLRTSQQKQIALLQNVKIQETVETLRKNNAGLKHDIQRLRDDPRAIESAARSIRMAHSNEIVLLTE